MTWLMCFKCTVCRPFLQCVAQKIGLHKHTEFPTGQLIGRQNAFIRIIRRVSVKKSSRMSDDEMMAIDDEEIAPSRNKGKGKAVDTGEMDDNLPW